MTSGTEMVHNSTILARFGTFFVAAVTCVACTSATVSVASPDGPLPTSPGLEIDVSRVSDGDSLRATSSEGDLEIRLLGVNAPERDDCFGDEARQELEDLLSGRSVVLHPWPGERDQFGRQLGFLVADGDLVNLSLVNSGHVIARSQSDHEFEASFEEAERAASDAARGLWARDACGEAPDADVRIVDVEEDAPGDDRENPNGEWVLIENAGDTVANLEGWTLRDESTRHRFIFPEIMLGPGQSVRIRTGCGDDTITSDPAELFWCDPEPPVWNNNGDSAFLLDVNGSVADSYDVTG